jgi:hypothetical protein
MSDTFDEFVKQQRAQAQSEKIDLVEELSTWLGKLDSLYEQVRYFLQEYVDKGDIKIECSSIDMYEELLGGYRASKLTISIGQIVVNLDPIGTFLIGARGRVDMKGPRGVARFVVVPPESTQARIRVRVFSHGETPAPEKLPPASTWVWKMATPPPEMRYIELTKESFREALLGVAHG